MTRDEMLGQINRRIAEAEVRSLTLAAEIAALSGADDDPAEMMERLWRTMDDLAELRWQRSAFELLGRPDPEPSAEDRR